MKVELQEKVEFQGKEYTELVLELERLRGKELIQADMIAKKISLTPSPVPVLSMPYHAAVAAVAANVPEGVILELKAADFSEVTTIVQNFLLDADSKVKKAGLLEK